MSPASQPPTTHRPSNHPLVELLTDGSPADYLDRIHGLLDPAGWDVATGSGFRWIPSKLWHQIELFEGELDGEPVPGCRSIITLASDCQDEVEAVHAAHYLNQRPFGAAAFAMLGERTIVAVSHVLLHPNRWFSVELWERVMMHGIGVAEAVAPWLSEWVGAPAPNAAHPDRGPRAQPDVLTTLDLDVVLNSPEASTGIFCTEAELEAFASAMEWFGRDVSVRSRAWAPPGNERSGQRLSTAVDFGLAGAPASLSVHEADHPDFGVGIEMLLTTGHALDGAPDLAVAPASSGAAVLLANTLNAVMSESTDIPVGLGGWTTWRGQLHYSTFVFPEDVRILQQSTSGQFGECLAIIANDVTSVGGELEALVGGAPDLVPDRAAIVTENGWDGVEENAGLYPLLGVDLARLGIEADAVPLNSLLEPLTLPLLDRLPHTRVFGTFGVFDPLGPTVGSIEVSVDYRAQLALLLERRRHPLQQHVLLHAVLDQTGFENVEPALFELVSSLAWPPFDWFEIRTDRPEEERAVRDGLLEFARQSDADFEHLARRKWSGNDPWEQLEDAPSVFGPPEHLKPEEAWVIGVTRSSVVETYVAHLRSAWSGAVAYSESGDPAAAQRVVDGCKSELRRRELGLRP